METDVCIIGGGPAGLAAAIATRRRGMRVLLADRAQPPIGKACGEGLMPDGVRALTDLGVLIGPVIGMPFVGIRFLDDGVAAEAVFAEGPGLGIRRVDLHRLLLAAAEAAGVITSWGTSAEVLSPGTVRMAGHTIRCRWIIGADGAHSRVRQRAGLVPAWTGRRRIGVRQHFRVRPWTGFVEVHWAQDAQAFVTPVATDEICIAFLAEVRPARIPEMMGRFPALRDRLAKAEPIGPIRGAISMSARLPRVTRGRFALIGDASGVVDAVTGEGISLALRQAEALGAALATDDLQSYERDHARISRPPHLAARLLLHFGANDACRRRVLATLATTPVAFEQLLAVHTGATGLVRGAAVAFSVAVRSTLMPRKTVQSERAAEPVLGLEPKNPGALRRGSL